MRPRGRRILLAGMLGVLALRAGPGAGAAGAGARTSPPWPLSPGRVALLPLVDYTGQSAAVAAAEQWLVTGLGEHGVPVVPADSLRATLRRLRIRPTGQILPGEAEALRQELTLRYALCGALEQYDAGTPPQLALSLRAVDLESLSVVWAASAASTGYDGEGLFGTGRSATMDDLAPRVLDALLARGEAPVRPMARVAVVPLDNFSARPRAGDVVSNRLLTELVRRGYRVAEPGLVSGVMLAHQSLWRGAIDRPNLEALCAALGVDLVITGAVESFATARGASDTAEPALELGLRVLDAAHARLLFTFDRAARGRDSEKLFATGRVYSVESLASRAARDFARDLEQRMGKEGPGTVREHSS